MVGHRGHAVIKQLAPSGLRTIAIALALGGGGAFLWLQENNRQKAVWAARRVEYRRSLGLVREERGVSDYERKREAALAAGSSWDLPARFAAAASVTPVDAAETPAIPHDELTPAEAEAFKRGTAQLFKSLN